MFKQSHRSCAPSLATPAPARKPARPDSRNQTGRGDLNSSATPTAGLSVDRVAGRWPRAWRAHAEAMTQRPSATDRIGQAGGSIQAACPRFAQATIHSTPRGCAGNRAGQRPFRRAPATLCGSLVFHNHGGLDKPGPDPLPYRRPRETAFCREELKAPAPWGTPVDVWAMREEIGQLPEIILTHLILIIRTPPSTLSQSARP